MVESQGRRRSAAERRRYTKNRAQRTAGGDKQRTPWSIEDARAALDESMTVTEAALAVGRTAVAVERLRAKWRSGRLPAGLANQVPPPPARTTQPRTRSRS
ncbi:hypothetical protein [Mycobacterium avium]|uniref:hypothetical protein n=1 Tax=Mycobacterium avium TaxID=1764 RepID=UPI000A04C040|nr:hypothetical protein [Mycobacterium avium]